MSLGKERRPWVGTSGDSMEKGQGVGTSTFDIQHPTFNIQGKFAPSAFPVELAGGNPVNVVGEGSART
jgi:hypothetical protein